MGIDGAGSNISPRIGPRDVSEAERSERAVEGPKQIARIERADRVEISTAGRELARADEAGGPLGPERRAEILARLESGFYHSAEVAEQVAGALVARGDL